MHELGDPGDCASHVPVEAIWELAKHGLEMSESHLAHVQDCGQCLFTLALCQICDSLTQVKKVI